MIQKITLENRYGNDFLQNEYTIQQHQEVYVLEKASISIIEKPLQSMEVSRFASSNATLIVSYTNENGDGNGVVFKKELIQPKLIGDLEDVKEFYSIQIYSELKTIQEKFDKGYNKEYDLYISEQHTTPLDSSCEHCGVSFDGGSMFENFVNQGKMGLSRFKDPKEVLKIVEEVYSPPYRFGNNISAVTENDRLKHFQCLKCENITENYER